MADGAKPIIISKVNLDIRWKQRFENYEKALRLLRAALADVESLSPLEKEGAVKRFEFTFELAWKTLKDYLEHIGLAVIPVAPRNVIKQAFAAGILADGQLWIDMLEDRNRMSHTYDETILDKTARDLAQRYLPALNDLYSFLKSKTSS